MLIMENTDSNLPLLAQIRSPTFSLYLCIWNLYKHADNIGIFAYICDKIKTYKYEEIEFYVPQLCQILITVETESMALEDLLIDLSSQNPHFTLLTFWQLQAHLSDLSDDPECYGFQVARRVLNALQYFLFNAGSPPSKNFRENVHPAIILSSAIAASIGMPQVAEHIAPVAISQGRKQKSFVFQLAKNYTSQLAKNITAKNTKLNAKRDSSLNSPNSKYDTIDSSDVNDKSYKKELPDEDDNEKNLKKFETLMDNNDLIITKSTNTPKTFKYKSSTNDGITDDNDIYANKKHNLSSTKSTASVNNAEDFDLSTSKLNLNQNSMSLPDFRESLNGSKTSIEEYKLGTDISALSSPVSLSRANSTSGRKSRHESQGSNASGMSTGGKNSYSRNRRTISPSLMKTTTKIKLLKSNYFKCETQFAIALQQLSLRLSQVPKEARLTTLKAELSLLNRDLPAEVDIPTLLPPSKKMKLHKIVRITPNEAAVLNSAEKVPFLLLIEYLSDEIDFDPKSDNNMRILRERSNKKYIFDIGTQTTSNLLEKVAIDNTSDKSISSSSPKNFFDEQSMDEEDLGDLSVVKMSNKMKNTKSASAQEAEFLQKEMLVSSNSVIPNIDGESNELRNSTLNFSTKFDSLTNEGDSSSKRANTDRVGREDLATHMRIAAVMLTQLDNPTNTLAQDQSAAIKARIIESMQSLQDNFGYEDIQNIRGQAGERKLENDLKLGGLHSSSETTYLGEDWETKKARIRKESPFGHYDNWELCSVISKTGDDLRQEAFACQLIQAMSQIWIRENVGVWIKKMRILITSANTGLVETITNALSVHSIKKALTKITIEEGNNPKGAVASLSLHFKKTFGDENSTKYKVAQHNFASSLASYSIICYLLQVKDRHNGNIMLDNEGHIIHIDFGFLLSNSPGSVGFEGAPFKLTLEYVEILGGLESEGYAEFKRLLKDAFLSIRKHSEHIIQMVELMQRDSLLPCFKAGDQTANQLRQRFQLHLSDAECEDFVENVLIQKSLGSLYTRLYDQFQLLTQGIYS